MWVNLLRPNLGKNCVLYAQHVIYAKFNSLKNTSPKNCIMGNNPEQIQIVNRDSAALKDISSDFN